MISSASSIEYGGARALVLGASGFIGRWVARLLAARGAHVFHAVRDRHAFALIFRRWDLAGDVVEADLAEPGAAAAMLRALRPSVTFNLAGYGVDPGERDEAVARRINSDLVEELATAASGLRDPRWRGLHVVHVGSALEYGATGGVLSEDSVPNPTTAYGKWKLEGTRNLERVAAEKEIRAVTARLFTVYGPGERPRRLLPALIETARTGRPTGLTAGMQKRDFTYVEDVAEGLCRLGLSGARPGEVVNLATGRLTSVRAFAETAAGVLNIPAELLQFGKLPTRSEEMEHSGVSIARLRGLVYWAPPAGIVEGIRKTLQFSEVEEKGLTLCDSNATIRDSR
jgi:nucleoside-diphosphate-sugar epimerase